MILTIYIPISTTSQNLTWETINKADKIGGMIEQVLDDLISWHNLKENEIESALDFIRETYGHITVKLCKEIYYGKYKSFCNTQFEKEIKL